MDHGVGVPPKNNNSEFLEMMAEIMNFKRRFGVKSKILARTPSKMSLSFWIHQCNPATPGRLKLGNHNPQPRRPLSLSLRL